MPCWDVLIRAKAECGQVACVENSFLTSAKASEKVGWDLRYHVACRIVCTLRVIRWWANRVTIENNPNSARAVLRMLRKSSRQEHLDVRP
jgi:predicted signal transduction protein with EAL and GGDEF domain